MGADCLFKRSITDSNRFAIVLRALVGDRYLGSDLVVVVAVETATAKHVTNPRDVEGEVVSDFRGDVGVPGRGWAGDLEFEMLLGVAIFAGQELLGDALFHVHFVSG